MANSGLLHTFKTTIGSAGSKVCEESLKLNWLISNNNYTKFVCDVRKLYEKLKIHVEVLNHYPRKNINTRMKTLPPNWHMLKYILKQLNEGVLVKYVTFKCSCEVRIRRNGKL